MVSQSSTIPKYMPLTRMITDLSKAILSNNILKRIKLVPAITSIDVYISISFVPFFSFLLQQQQPLCLLAIFSLLHWFLWCHFLVATSLDNTARSSYFSFELSCRWICCPTYLMRNHWLCLIVVKSYHSWLALSPHTLSLFLDAILSWLDGWLWYYRFLRNKIILSCTSYCKLVLIRLTWYWFKSRFLLSWTPIRLLAICETGVCFSQWTDIWICLSLRRSKGFLILNKFLFTINKWLRCILNMFVSLICPWWFWLFFHH